MNILNHNNDLIGEGSDVSMVKPYQRDEYKFIPERLWFKKVVANMENYSEQSFKWAVTRALNPVGKNPQWITRDLRRQTEQYNWDGVSFPTPLSQIEIFEKNNNVLVNVFRWDEMGERAHPIRIPTGKHESRALLILIDEIKGHYVVVKSMQGIFRKQTGRGGRRFYCNNCLVDFSSDEALQKHVVCCEKLDYPSCGIVPKKTKPKKRLEVVVRPKESLKNKNATINMKCNDKESFKWSVTRALNPTTKSSERITKVLRVQSENYNWEGLDFPTPLSQIETFERNNNLLINVFELNEEKGCVQTLRVSKGVHTGRVLLMLVDDRYLVVKSVSRLLYGQDTKRHCGRFYCNNCLKGFTSEEKFGEHITSLCEFSEKLEDSCDLCCRYGGSLCSLHIGLEEVGEFELIPTMEVRERE